VGRPKRRWIEEVEKGLKEVGVRAWRGVALGRSRWKNVVEDAKA
jgi:hypothetical protein